MKHIKFICTSLLMAVLVLSGCKGEDVTISGIKISSTAATIKIGSTVVLSYTYEPSDAKVETAVWSSSNENIATVDQNGTVTGVNEGNANITVKVNNQYTATCAVTVITNVTGVKLSSHEMTIKVDSIQDLTYTIEPAGAKVSKVEWISSDTDVAWVFEGQVNGIKEGTATITIKINDQFTDVCTVTVLPNPVFTVADGKTVQFSPANLYWDGSAWQFEKNQYDCQTTWSATHVSHLYWTKTAAASYAENYSDGTCTTSDKFFADGSDDEHKLTVAEQSGWFALSKDQWNYLLNIKGTAGRTDANRFAKAKINSINGILLFPDGYTGTVSGDGIGAMNTVKVDDPSTSIPTETWSSMEKAGCVFIPRAGRRFDSEIENVDVSCFYWSTTPDETGPDSAYFLTSGGKIIIFGSTNRRVGLSVRLVRE